MVVVPHAGTWIEIKREANYRAIRSSFPTRERGLKLPLLVGCCSVYHVVPHAGTWIEITAQGTRLLTHSVVPHAGTWIEIKSTARS